MSSKRNIYDIDLSHVRTRDDFQREMGRHFKMEADHNKIWDCISLWLLYQPTACTLRFRGWVQFEQHMPQYARRLRRKIKDFQKAMSEDTYTAEYL
jgi:hypothetical protein